MQVVFRIASVIWLSLHREGYLTILSRGSDEYSINPGQTNAKEISGLHGDKITVALAATDLPH